MDQHQTIANESPGRRHRTPWTYVRYGLYCVVAIVFVSLLVVLIFPDTFINGFLKDPIMAAVNDAYPTVSIRAGDLHYDIWNNRLECDSIIVEKKDSTLGCTLGRSSVQGISWLKVLLQGKPDSMTFASAVIDARDLRLHLRDMQHELRCGTIHASIPDSSLTMNSVHFYPIIDDEEFFARSRYRQTRMRVDVTDMRIHGMDCRSMLSGHRFAADSILILGAGTDILVNMDRPYQKGPTPPQMPNEAFAELKQTVAIRLIRLTNGQLKYCEKVGRRSRPGAVTFRDIRVSVRDLANHSVRPDTTMIQGEGRFMDAGIMTLSMAIPLTSPEYSLRCSGSLGPMNLSHINSFIEQVEHRRVTAGRLHSATYQIAVVAGRAKGTLHAQYSGLRISILNKRTGSARGIFDRLASLYGRLFVLRGSNMRDEDGAMKIGAIRYRRYPEDYFFQYLWFALRSGVADVLGLPLA